MSSEQPTPADPAPGRVVESGIGDKSSPNQLYFVPLEANPELLTTLAHRLGLSSSLQFVDVFSLTDPDLLGFIPRPALALLLVFPLTEKYEEDRVKEDDGMTMHPGGGAEGDEGVDEKVKEVEGEVLWFKQTIRNACGLMGMLHAMMNGAAREFITPDSTLSSLLKAATPLPTPSRSALLEQNQTLANLYGEVALQGDTPAPDAKSDLDLHYVTFVKSSTGKLWELDGRRKGPLMRVEGLGEEEDVLCAKALEAGALEFLRKGGGDMRFSAVALVRS